MMKSIEIRKGLLEKLVDFLLGPAPHPVYMAGSAAGFGGVGGSERKRSTKVVRFDRDDDSASLALAASGMGSYSVSNQKDGRVRR